MVLVKDVVYTNKLLVKYGVYLVPTVKKPVG